MSCNCCGEHYDIKNIELDMYDEKIAPYFKEEDEPFLNQVFELYIDSYNEEYCQIHIKSLKKIDNINVSLYLRHGEYVSNRKFIQLWITFTDITEEFREKRLMLATHDIGEKLTMKHVKIMMYLLNHLKFDKLNGRFIPTYIPITTHKQIHKLFRAENIETNIKECCVCYEETKTLTNCGHPLCYECHSKIKATEDEENVGETCKHCPICRKDIGWVESDE